MLTIGLEPGKFAVQQRAKTDVWRSSPCLTNYKGETCFVIGGCSRDHKMLGSVSRYNIGKDKWEPDTPDLNVRRKSSSACTLGDFVFVFSGRYYGGAIHNSVERINAPAIASGGAAWELIELPEHVIPRLRIGIVPLNKSEIAILGGYS